MAQVNYSTTSLISCSSPSRTVGVDSGVLSQSLTFGGMHLQVPTAEQVTDNVDSCRDSETAWV